MKHYITIIMIISIFMVGVTMGAQELDKPVKGVKVTILIYSGRPNPTFTITDENLIKKIENVLKTKPQKKNLKDKTVSPSVLGYNGILVENFSDLMPELESFLVYHSKVELKSKKPTEKGVTTEILEDTTSELQDMLIKEAQARGIINQKLIDCISKK